VASPSQESPELWSRSPRPVPRPTEEIASELLMIPESEVGFRMRFITSVDEDFLVHWSYLLGWRLGNGASTRHDRSSRRSHKDQLPDAAWHDRLHPWNDLEETMCTPVPVRR
jgi:hypothetical protein